MKAEMSVPSFIIHSIASMNLLNRLDLVGDSQLSDPIYIFLIKSEWISQVDVMYIS